MKGKTILVTRATPCTAIDIIYASTLALYIQVWLILLSIPSNGGSTRFSKGQQQPGTRTWMID